MSEDLKFYISNLPGAGFDYHWEVAAVTKEEFYVHYDPTYPRNERRENLGQKPVGGEWMVNLVNEDGKVLISHKVTRLDDDTLRFATEFLAMEFVARNRAKALEEGPVRLMRDDDPS